VSASKIADDDAHGAYALIYDAARKAIAAHMLTTGYRVAASRPGAHAATAAYAEAQWDGTEYEESVRRFDRMRRNRNPAQYGSWHVGAPVLERDLQHSKNIVEAVEQALR
jgi:hypothetical protein